MTGSEASQSRCRLFGRRQTECGLPRSASNEGVILTHLAGKVAYQLENLSSEAERPPEGTRCGLAAPDRAPYERNRQQRQEAWHPVPAQRDMVNKVEADFAVQPATHEVGSELPQVVMDLHSPSPFLPKERPRLGDQGKQLGPLEALRRRGPL